MRCAHSEAEFTQKNTRRRFCSSRCRSASWQGKRIPVQREQLLEIRALLKRTLEETYQAKGEVEKILGG